LAGTWAGSVSVRFISDAQLNNVTDTVRSFNPGVGCTMPHHIATEVRYMQVQDLCAGTDMY